MYTDSELAETIAALENPNPSERAAMLKALWAWPSQDNRLLPHIRTLLGDTAPCVFGSPMRIGEIRWLAAQVIFAEFKLQKRKEAVRLELAVKPIPKNDLTTLAGKHSIPCDGSLGHLLAAFESLQALGKLPMTELELTL